MSAYTLIHTTAKTKTPRDKFTATLFIQEDYNAEPSKNVSQMFLSPSSAERVSITAFRSKINPRDVDKLKGGQPCILLAEHFML